jgi:NAD(P)-dependent dehydrogenase (short-subunit alcohol dehydrogenase family)
VNYRSGEAEAAEVVKEIEEGGGRAVAVQGDVSDFPDAERVVQETVDRLGGLHVLVNNAGIARDLLIFNMEPSDWLDVMRVNFGGVFNCTKAALSQFMSQREGTIVNISSVAGKRGWADAAAYCASKFALTGLTQALAAEGREYGIRVCVLYPGAMATSWGSWSADERTQTTPPGQDPRDALHPDRVAALVVWLASAPPEVVLGEAVVTPLNEQGWP